MEHGVDEKFDAVVVRRVSFLEQFGAAVIVPFLATALAPGDLFQNLVHPLLGDNGGREGDLVVLLRVYFVALTDDLLIGHGVVILLHDLSGQLPLDVVKVKHVEKCVVFVLDMVIEVLSGHFEVVSGIIANETGAHLNLFLLMLLIS